MRSSISLILSSSLLILGAWACSPSADLPKGETGDNTGTETTGVAGPSGGATGMPGSGGGGAGPQGAGGGELTPGGSGGALGTGSSMGAGGETLQGAGGATGSGGQASGGGCKGADILCEDFESYTAETFPTGSIWLPEGESCEFQSGQFLNRVAADKAHGGSQAFKMTNKTFAACRLAGKFGDYEDFWIKAHIWWDEGVSFDNRETIAIDLTTIDGVSPQPKDDPAVRFGFRTKEPCTMTPGPQVTIIGFGEEATGCGNLPIPQGKWYCMEAHVTQSAGLLSVKTYLDGQDFQYGSVGKDPVDTVSHATDVHVDHIRLGIFSTGEAQGNAYLDDLAISTTRVGCD